LTPDSRHLVPDTRWFPQRNTATYAVQALLAGPSTWLQDSVVSGVPVGTDLEVDAVSVDSSGVARVDLSSAVLQSSETQRGQLKAQLETTLLRIAGIRAVDLLAAGVPLSVTEPITPERDPMPAVAPIALVEGEVVELVGQQPQPISGLASVADADVTALARGDADGVVYLRLGTDRIATLAPGQNSPATLFTGTDLVAPSVDRYGWVWTGERTGTLHTVRGSEEVTVAADWLEGQEIVALRVSRDGTRLAVVSRAAGAVQIDVVGVVRDDRGAPQRVSEQTSVGASLLEATQVVWVDEATLAVLGRSTGSGPTTVHTVPLGGRTEALSPIEGAVSIASGRGLRSIYVETDTGQLFTRGSTGIGWVPAAENVADFTYSG
ncbi:MAG: LpqB family beta-propeller domain-containing protein, partial [Cellulomonadaceae bacterium]